MKVLIVHCGEGIYGGAELVIVELCKYLKAGGHEAMVVTKGIPRGSWHGDMWYDAHDWLDFWKEVQNWIRWVDVVNVHNFPASLATFPKHIPTVWMCNEPAELFTNWWRKPIEAFNRWWVKKSGMKVVVADRFNADRFERIYKVKPEIIPYGVDYEFWSSGERIKREGGKIRLLQVGTISPYKNQLASILTLIELLRNGIDAELTLAGSVTDEKYYKSLISNINYVEHIGMGGFMPRIALVGQKSREEVRNLFNSHDILLHPVKEQGGWLAPFEAICAGLPIIVSPEFTGADVVIDNGLGIVTSDLIGAIRDIYEKQVRYEAWTKDNGKWVKENLSWENFGEGMLEVFEEAKGPLSF